MTDPDIEVHIGDTWTCHVCGRTRADRDISVRKFAFIGKDPKHSVVVNVRYCNDTPSCFAGTTDVPFVQSAFRAFAGES